MTRTIPSVLRFVAYRKSAGMILVGYLAMVLMGMLPLMGLAQFLGVSEEQRFLLPVPWAIATGFVIGFAFSYLLGRALGLVGAGVIGTYEERLAASSTRSPRASRRGLAAHVRRGNAVSIRL